MKTTVEITDGLLRRVKRLAAEEGTSVRELIEEGLEMVVESRSRPGYRLPDASFGGDGLAPGITEGDWHTIRALIYQGRGA